MLSTPFLYIVCYIYSYLLICTTFKLIVMFLKNKKNGYHAVGRR